MSSSMSQHTPAAVGCREGRAMLAVPAGFPRQCVQGSQHLALPLVEADPTSNKAPDRTSKSRHSFSHSLNLSPAFAGRSACRWLSCCREEHFPGCNRLLSDHATLGAFDLRVFLVAELRVNRLAPVMGTANNPIDGTANTPPVMGGVRFTIGSAQTRELFNSPRC